MIIRKLTSFCFIPNTTYWSTEPKQQQNQSLSKYLSNTLHCKYSCVCVRVCEGHGLHMCRDMHVEMLCAESSMLSRAKSSRSEPRWALTEAVLWGGVSARMLEEKGLWGSIGRGAFEGGGRGSGDEEIPLTRYLWLDARLIIGAEQLSLDRLYHTLETSTGTCGESSRPITRRVK